MATWHNPGEGYDTFEGSAPDLWASYLAYHNLVTTADSARTIVATAWKGEGATALRDLLLAFAAELGPIQETLTTARSALITYNSSLGACLSSSYVWQGQWESADREFNSDWNLNPLDWEAFTEDKRQKDRAYRNRREAEIELQTIYGYRRDADARVIQALNSAVPASWAEQSAAFASAGVTPSVLLSSSESKQAMLDLAARMLDGNGDYSDETIAAMTGLLNVWGGDQTTMSTFFSKLGGADTVELIDRLGEQMGLASGAYGQLGDGDQALITLAFRIRSGLALGSEHWGPEFTNGFLDDMMTGNPEYFEARADTSGDTYFGDSATARIQAIAFLFGDPQNAPLSENFAVAAADMVDQMEREDGFQGLVNPTPPTSGFGASVFGMFTEDGVYTGDTSGNDLPGRVFETLGYYPDAALEFLTEAGQSTPDRVQYWFTDREWTLDGFSGPASLWTGAAAVVGPESAMTVSEIMFAIDDNASFISENVSDEGSIFLAAAVSMDLPALAGYMAVHDPTQPMEAGVGSHDLFGTGGTVDAPLSNTSVIAKIFGVIGAHEGGSIQLQQTATMWQDIALAYGIAHPESFEEGMRQASVLQAAMDGSGIGDRVAVAERSDQAREEMMDTMSTLIGMVPVPAIGDAVIVGGHFAADLAQSILLSLGEDAALDWIGRAGEDRAAAIAQMGLDQQEQAQRMAGINASYLYALIQSDGAQEAIDAYALAHPDFVVPNPERPPSVNEFNNPADYAGGMNEWYGEGGDPTANNSQLSTLAQIVLGRPDFDINGINVAYETASGFYINEAANK